MIISHRHGFVFVHIPKCAGTSVRTQIERCDPTHVALAEVDEHPVLGRIDYGHIPLPLLREHFPDEYWALETLTSFAIVRDPLSRFGSALRQMLWQYEKRPMTLVPRDELRELALRAIDEAAAGIGASSARHIFFARQSDFVFDGDRRLVRHLVPIEEVAAFIAFLAEKTNTSMDPETRSNQNVELRFKGLGPLAYRINGFLRQRLPLSLHARLKDAALSLLSARGSAAEASGILDLPEVRDFVAEAYARDTELHALARAEAPQLLAGFADASLALGPVQEEALR